MTEIDHEAIRRHQQERTKGVPPAKPPQLLIGRWKVRLRNEDGYMASNDRHTLIVSDAREDDGRIWRHFSLCGQGRLPTWSELVEAKEIFLGTEAKAIQVIPPRSQYVNIRPDVLHLFVCLDEDPLPDFTGGTGSL
jgi:hypothetical protein